MSIGPIGKKQDVRFANFVENHSKESINNTIFDGNYWQSQNEESLWGVNFSAPNNNIQPEKSDFDWLEKDTKGKYNSEQFNLENLKQHYPESIYNIIESTENKSTVYTITNKSNGKIAYVFDIYKGDSLTSIDCTKFDSNDKEFEKISINDGLITSKRQILPNGNIKDSRFYNNIVTKEILLTPNYEEIETVLYSKGKPYKKTKNEKTEINFLVNDLKSILDDKNLLGVLNNPEGLYDLIDMITQNNVYEVLIDYKNITGNDLLEVLTKASDKMTILKNGFSSFGFMSRTTEKIEQCMRNCAHRDGFNTNEEDYIANLLIDNIYGVGSGSLKKTLDYITQYNIEEVLAKYRELASKKHEELSKNPLIPKYIVDKFAPEEGLFKAILNENSLKNEQQQIILKLINKFGIILNKNTLNEFQDIDFNFIFENSTKYCDDIKASMKLNQDNPERLLIDIQRFINRGTCKDVDVTRPNGLFDIDFKQGNTGDCWLLAGIISIINKDSGKKSLESLIEVDNEKEVVTVNLEGVGKSYTISFNEIEAADHLSGGDGDIRALELAIDRYQQEIAYSDDSRSGFDINGNSVDYIYKLFFNETENISGYSKEMAKDFNNSNKYYSLGSSIFEIDNYDIVKGALVDENDVPVDFVLAHAYAIVKSDDKYVYLINPWESSQTLRITHEKLSELNPSIGCNK